jgi:hypothetical protein
VVDVIDSINSTFTHTNSKNIAPMTMIGRSQMIYSSPFNGPVLRLRTSKPFSSRSTVLCFWVGGFPAAEHGLGVNCSWEQESGATVLGVDRSSQLGRVPNSPGAHQSTPITDLGDHLMSDELSPNHRAVTRFMDPSLCCMCTWIVCLSTV